MPNLEYFKFWCYKVLPLVYDDSLSYYEVLCKVVKYINGLIEQDKIFGEELNNLRGDLDSVEQWIHDFNTEYAEQIIRDYLACAIFVEINKQGYIVYNVPESWDEIIFNTVGLDIQISDQEYGTLVLSY